MNRRLIPKFLILILLLASIQACKPRREIVPVVDELLRSPERALRALHSNQADFEYYSARFSGEATWEGKTYPMAGSLKIKKDEIIFLSIAPVLGIEVARVMITPDTVKYLNRLQSSYFVGDMEFFNKLLGADLDFYMLQAILMGNDFEHFTAEDFRVTDDRSLIYLHSPGRRSKDNLQGPPLDHKIWMEPVNYRIRRAVAQDESGEQIIEADYNNFENLEGQWLPNDLAITFTDPGDRAEIKIRLNRTSLNQPQEFSFSIPSRYTPMEL